MKPYTYPFTCLIIIIWLTPTTLSAQNSRRWFRKELSVAQSSVYDNAHSFARYKGTGLRLQLGLDRETIKSLRQLNSALLWTPLKAKVDDRKNVTSATQINYSLNYMYLRKIGHPQSDNIQIAAGASVLMDANARYYSSLINNAFGWDINLGVNAVAQAIMPFRFKKHSFQVRYQLGIPFIVYNHSPNFLGTYPIGKTFRQGDRSDWFTLGRFVPGLNEKYFYIHQQLSIDKTLSNGDKIRLTYTWDYSNNGYASHRYQNLITGVSIGILTSFSKRDNQAATSNKK